MSDMGWFDVAWVAVCLLWLGVYMAQAAWWKRAGRVYAARHKLIRECRTMEEIDQLIPPPRPPWWTRL